MAGKNNIGNGLDQFYTNPKYAQHCYKITKEKVPNFKLYDLELEPSAGDGSFYKLLSSKKRYGIDLDPQCDGVVKQDFFTYKPKSVFKRIITIGNPPFGKNASLAIKFFNHAAEFSNVIAFVVPKSFKKVSVQNKLDLDFSLFYELNCPKNSFILNGNKHDVPCVFQIWVKSKTKRKKLILDMNNDIFKFVKKNENPDIAIKRVGGNTGTCTTDVVNATETTSTFIKLKNKTLKTKIVKYINNLDFGSVRDSTAGPRSLSKYEFVDIFFKGGW